MIRRVDNQKFQKVEEAIKLADEGKTEEAAIFCKAEDIPVEVAYRIITKPTQRRSNLERRLDKE